MLDLQIQEMAQLEAGTKEERQTLTPSVLSFFLEGKKKLLMMNKKNCFLSMLILQLLSKYQMRSNVKKILKSNPFYICKYVKLTPVLNSYSVHIE